MLKNDIYLGEAGTEYLLPMGGRVFLKGYVEIARADRTASGRGVKDIVALKKKFNIEYSLIDDAELNQIIDLYELEEALEITVRKMDDTTEKFNVLLQPFEASRILAVGNGLWGNVILNMEEV